MASSLSARSAIVCLLVGALALATGGCDKRSGEAGQASGNAAAVSPDEAAPSAPAAKVGAVDRSHKGEAPPETSFTTLDGKPASLASFKGKPVLVNLWATWCAPCVKELPTLDAAAGAAKGKLTVIAISQDMDPAKARTFLAAHKLAAITPFLDPKLSYSLALAANLPTTILYGGDGKEIWRVTGDRDWTSAESKQLIADAR